MFVDMIVFFIVVNNSSTTTKQSIKLAASKTRFVFSWYARKASNRLNSTGDRRITRKLS